MAQFPKARIVQNGENPGGFRSVGPDKYSNRDPTQSPPKADTGAGVVWGGYGRDRDGERWGQVDRGQVDRQGDQHDW